MSAGSEFHTVGAATRKLRAATGGEAMTSGPMYGTNVALVVMYADAQRDRLSNCPK